MAPVPSPRSSSDGPRKAPQPTVLANRYRLERHLAQGGMAEVWLATDITLDRQVALKWLRPSLATDPVVAERFRREAIAVAGLNHPNIVAVHDVFEEDGRQAVVMQLVDGKSLRQVLDGQRQLSPDLTIHIGNCVAAALDAAHKAGFVHRDVKPGNIMLTPDGRVLLTDFGIAKGLASSSSDDLTHDNVMMGTAKYLSPEQVRGKRLDGRADLYSLGLVMYECLAGKVPFQGESDADTALARLQRDPTDLARLRPNAPPGLVTIVHRLLARNPDHRPASGAELRAGLARVSSEPADSLERTGESSHMVADSVRAVGPRTTGRNPRLSGSQRRVTGSHPLTGGRAGGPATRTTGSNRRVERSGPRTGSVPVYAEHTPPRVHAPRPDRTPEAGPRIRGTPARSMEQRLTPSLTVVAILLLFALVVILVLYTTLRNEPSGNGDRNPATTAVAAAAPRTQIASLGTFDPDRDGENDDQVNRALTGSGSFWSTKCYQSEFMGATQHVGLTATLEGATGGTVSADIGTAPFQVSVYASPNDNLPVTLTDWGGPLKSFSGNETANVTTVVPAGTRHLMLLFTQIGEDPGCTSANRYRGSISNLGFTPG